MILEIHYRGEVVHEFCIPDADMSEIDFSIRHQRKIHEVDEYVDERKYRPALSPKNPDKVYRTKGSSHTSGRYTYGSRKFKSVMY